MSVVDPEVDRGGDSTICLLELLIVVVFSVTAEFGSIDGNRFCKSVEGGEMVGSGKVGLLLTEIDLHALGVVSMLEL
jgi:hypothetical protein